ncbi:hypothetical protein ACPRNU_23890 [Chromobacterium vaccinii]|uniref:hypothetical protein n=1 Tax=Chromobacterium vaccinii TaxID=1108595 RepID=UPI003C7882F6
MNHYQLQPCRAMPQGFVVSGARLMRTWYLQTDGNRRLIDDHIHSGFVELDRCEAENWLAAKRMLVSD